MIRTDRCEGLRLVVTATAVNIRQRSVERFSIATPRRNNDQVILKLPISSASEYLLTIAQSCRMAPAMVNTQMHAGDHKPEMPGWLASLDGEIPARLSQTFCASPDTTLTGMACNRNRTRQAFTTKRVSQTSLSFQSRPVCNRYCICVLNN